MRIKKIASSIFFVTVFVLLSGCAKTTSLHETVGREDGSDLTKEYAAYRERYVKDVAYDVHIDFASDANAYSGSNRITFNLAAVPSPGLTLDTGNKIDELICNGKKSEFTQHSGFISLSPNCLRKGKNALSVKYKGTFTSVSHGLTKYVDSKSGNSYIYTDFEPNYASTVIPLFDQPDIKASFSLSVDVPPNWIVVSAMPESKTSSDSQRATWTFEKTQPIPSYVFSIVAGPFQIINDKPYTVPLRLIVRPEVASQVKAETIFKMTRQSLDFFTEYFNAPFPFPKYDQVFLPNLGLGFPKAMENAGATSINEQIVFSRPLNIQSDIISHEIAHMWLGNLVTLKWWGDLWLNEGLAEYMSALQRANNSDFKQDVWSEFFERRVRSAFGRDESASSHPVKFAVPKVSDVESKFDGITYSKSAALLRQLSSRVGEVKFQQGLQAYIRQYAWKNANSDQFFEQIQDVAGTDLRPWVKSWYETSGLNQITLSFSCEKSGDSNRAELRQVLVKQSGVGGNMGIREQSVNAGLYYRGNGKYTLKAAKQFVLSSASSTFELNETTPCPDLIYPNQDDIGYFKVQFEPKELESIAANIEQFEYPLRDRLWDTLWGQVEAGSLSVEQYILIVSDMLRFEPEGFRKTGLVQSLGKANFYLSKIPIKTEKVNALIAKATEIVRRQYLEAKDPRFQSLMFGNYIDLIATKKDLAELNSILTLNYLPQKQSLNQLTRWQILRKLRQYGADNAGMVQEERDKDSSPLGRKFFNSIDAVTNNSANKQKWISAVTSDSGGYPTSDLDMVSIMLFPSNQIALYRDFESEIYNLVEKGSVEGRISEERLGLVANMIRPECTNEGLAGLKMLDKKLLGRDSFARQSLLKKIRESEICLAISKNF